MKYAVPKGCFDIMPSEVGYYLALERVIRELCHDFGYVEVRTPIFERTELFTRSVGETSDIVSKEMYTFEDKAGRSMSLRPEGTAPVMRAYVEHGMHHSPFQKYYYIGPYFRYDRPQAGRYRQFHQFGVEHIGRDDVEADFESIDLLWQLYQRLGLKKLTLLLNSIGEKACRDAYQKALKEYLRPHYAALGEESKMRFEKNPLRILDTKNQNERTLLKEAPSILDFLSEGSLKHFEALQALLKARDIPYTVDTSLVRGLDYYNHTVFEVTAEALGAQNTIGAGGRYDGLIAACGGPNLPGVGFATGIERILVTLKAQEIARDERPTLDLLLIPLGESSTSFAFDLLTHLRRSNIATEIYAQGKKVQKGLQLANDIRAKHVLVIGDDEMTAGYGEIKHLAQRSQHKVKLDPCSIKEHIRATL